MESDDQIDNIHRSNNTLYQTLDDIVSKLNTVLKPQVSSEDDSLILKLQHDYLEACKKHSSKSTADTEPEVRNTVSSETLIQEYEKSIQELQMTLSVLRSQRKVLMADIEKDKEVNRQLFDVQESIQFKLQEGDQSETPADEYKKRLENRLKKAEQHGKELRKVIGAFINKHFPLPSEEDVKEAKKKLRSTCAPFSKDNMFSLKIIVEDLVNKYMEEPNDPYLTVDESFWPPYVELLLRCQVILRHPEDKMRIKLVPFHL